MLKLKFNLNSRDIVFFSIIFITYIIGNFIPVESTLACFCSMLFYYFIGLKSIGFYYIIFSAECIRCFPFVYAISENANRYFTDSFALIDKFFSASVEKLNLTFNMPIIFWLFFLYFLVFMGSIINFGIAKLIIKKFKVLKMLGVDV